MPQAQWLKIKSAAEYADCCPRTIMNWLKLGLRHSRIGGSTRIRSDWIDDFFNEREVKKVTVDIDQVVDEICNGL